VDIWNENDFSSFIIEVYNQSDYDKIGEHIRTVIETYAGNRPQVKTIPRKFKMEDYIERTSADRYADITYMYRDPSATSADRYRYRF
jgi:hypothetical protein